MVGDDQLDVRVRGDVAGEGRRAGGRVGVGGGVDLQVVHRQAGFFEGVDDALGALAAAGLREQAPDHGAVAALQAEALDGFLAQVVAGRVVHGADIAEAVALVLAKAGRQFGVLAGDDDALGFGVVDQRREGVVAGVAHDGDAVGLGGDCFLELLDHLLRIPVGEDIADVGAQIGFGLLGAVVDVVGEDAARRAAGEEGDLDILAPLAAPSAAGAAAACPAAPATAPPGCTAVQACKSNAAISSTASAAKRTYRERNCIRSSCCLKRFNGARKKTVGSGK